MTIEHLENLRSLHYFPAISDGVHTWSFIGRRRLFGSSATSRLFCHTLPFLRYHMMKFDDRWMRFGEYVAHVGQLCTVPSHYLADYLDWFYRISHPFMTPAQSGDPSRVLLVQEEEQFVEPHMYDQLMAATAPNEADIDQHDLRHAVVIFCVFVCFFWYFYYLVSNYCHFCFISLARMTLQ